MSERPNHVGKNVKGTPAIGCCAGGLGLILLLRATYLLPTEYKGGFCRYDVIDLTTKLPMVALAESEFSNLRVSFWPSANALKTATDGTANIRTQQSGLPMTALPR